MVEHIIGGMDITIQVAGLWYRVPLVVLREYGISMPTAWRMEISEERLVQSVKKAILSSGILDYIEAFRRYDNLTNPAGE